MRPTITERTSREGRPLIAITPMVARIQRRRTTKPIWRRGEGSSSSAQTMMRKIRISKRVTVSAPN